MKAPGEHSVNYTEDSLQIGNDKRERRKIFNKVLEKPVEVEVKLIAEGDTLTVRLGQSQVQFTT